MSRSAPRALFGVHGATPYSRSTGLPYGELRVMKGSNLTLTGNQAELMGGASKYPWAVEEGEIKAELSMSVGQLEDFMFELFLGKAPTANNAEASGSVTTAVNVKGTSVIDPSNGISAVALTSADGGDLKFGKYAIVATGAAAFDLYLLSGVDRGRGNNADFQSDAMKITASPISVASATGVDANTGLSFTKAGTPAFVTGDSATFYVRPINSKSMNVVIGSVADQTFPEFGCLVYAQRRGQGEMAELDLYRCKAAGMPLPFDMGAFAGFELKCKVLYDEAADGLFQFRHVTPT